MTSQDTEMENPGSRGGTTSQDVDSEKASTSNGNIIDWDGPEDPKNPLNWPLWKKLGIISTVSFITFLSPLASTIIAPGTARLMEEFGSTNESLGAFVTSAHVVGYVFGPLLIAPVSEVWGRNIAYHVCNVLFCIFVIACAVANNMGSLIVFRLFAGIVSSCPITLGGGTIADMIPAERRGLAMAAWTFGPLFGPSVGPIIGGYVTEGLGWRWNFWILAILVGFTCILSVFILRESYPPVLLKWKTKALIKSTGNIHLRPARQTNETTKEVFMRSILRPTKMLFLSPIVFITSLYMALVYGYVYLCFTTFPRIFSTQYGFSLGASGLAYLGIGVGSMIGLVIGGALMDPISKSLAEKNGGVSKPEFRFPVMVVGSVLVPAGLFWYGWSAYYKTHWIVPIMGSGCLGAGMVVLFVPCQTYLVDVYTVYAASALAAATVFRSIFGAVLPLAGDAMYNSLGVGWGTSVLGFIAVAFLPMPFVFFLFGERIRQFSQVKL